MGVRGLTQYCKYNNQCSEKINLTYIPNLSLVVDGWALIYHLYIESQCNWLHGGDYPQFYEYLVSYFQIWKQQNIRLSIVFDGCIEPRKEGFFCCSVSLL